MSRRVNIASIITVKMLVMYTRRTRTEDSGADHCPPSGKRLHTNGNNANNPAQVALLSAPAKDLGIQTGWSAMALGAVFIACAVVGL
jgi:hypothetical protein